MSKKYSVETIGNLVEGIRLAQAQGLSGKRGNFFDKFILSIVELHTIIQDNKYTSHWNRKQADHFHTWLSYDESDRTIVLNSRRQDEWSTGLIDQALEQFDQSSVAEWLGFTESQEYKTNLGIVCDYYSRTGGYFRRLIQLHRDGETLNKGQYNKIVNNKYAQKVITAINADPIFDKGSLVDFRTSHEETYDENGTRRVYKNAPLGLLILSSDAPIVSACKGAKRYKVVPIGNNEPFYVEERWLKKRKKRK
tara:strand:+ start:295 stop:1047 length:753 start_codon:yes stop_codon:yes gene_type:complete